MQNAISYTVGPRGLKARTGTGHTAAQWAAVQAAIAKAGTTGCTVQALQAALTAAGQHPSGAAYFVRMAWLVPVVPATATATATATPAKPAKA